ncbi:MULTISPECIES: ABC transporter permease [unclassified Mucilaginibacter]|uniref:ABC transporter permease n=1 Tax=unclassified Mucilaginibacter TaxID=2617802 RepID=UPI002AC8A594|nr:MULTISPECIES: ABC transporter permease [unclassified Mucilaginibacter]MEB0248756.1 ABC transporter permease [Mucilaginibacter sp. 5B2]MEB0263335.1 ABC transporter permease [Mucilaginibacter sp. 10I4]MEB0280719.1 ABC transporter permease [Mucilaginibacter sp. 10B2]MEB0301436.1 ABC transporter permease [Mucilaginibacter sp. 5C4]WPX22691.1 ABC transporter permease [Mucilaginibacter sp. 5C4]
MNKILLIIQREYVTRVRKKAFLIMMFAVPLLLAGMTALIAYVAKDNNQITKPQVVKVIDESHLFESKLKNAKNIQFIPTDETVEKAKEGLKDNEDLSVLLISKNYAHKPVQFFSKKKPSFTLTGEVENQMNEIASTNTMLANHIDTALLNQAKKNRVNVSAMEVTEAGTKDANVGASMGVGIACAILIYMSLFIYGAQVMRGVIEEKTSRIIEVIISSVKPFQLMLGKIIGVGLVGLTQFTAWIVLSIIATKVAGNNSSSGIMGALQTLQTIPVGYVLGCFLFYFITGYLLYSALFAAVGSAVDSETETQQFMFPITLPLLFTYILSVSVLFQAPDSPLAVWLSIIPFTAPVAMMVRIPFGGVPDWQLALSMFMMVVGFLFTTYVAARIYRVGILMYGKKASFKELSKWFFYKE